MTENRSRDAHDVLTAWTRGGGIAAADRLEELAGTSRNQRNAILANVAQIAKPGIVDAIEETLAERRPTLDEVHQREAAEREAAGLAPELPSRRTLEPRPAIEPAAAYEHAHMIARDMLAAITADLNRSTAPESACWRHVDALNRLNATLSTVAAELAAMNGRHR